MPPPVSRPMMQAAAASRPMMQAAAASRPMMSSASAAQAIATPTREDVMKEMMKHRRLQMELQQKKEELSALLERVKGNNRVRRTLSLQCAINSIFQLSSFYVQPTVFKCLFHNYSVCHNPLNTILFFFFFFLFFFILTRTQKKRAGLLFSTNLFFYKTYNQQK